MRVAALFSGGKDSTLAARVAEEHGWDVARLVTVEPRAPESYMFHVPNVHLAPLLAEAWGKPLTSVPSSGSPERELDELEATLAQLRESDRLDGIVAGALASEYQRTRFERVAHRVGLKSFTPLWHKPPRAILDLVTRAGWDVRFAGVAAEGLTQRWLGRRLDPEACRELERLRERYGVHVGGEGGEFETLVLDAPFWPRRVVVEDATPVWKRDHGVWVVRSARVAPKGDGNGARAPGSGPSGAAAAGAPQEPCA